MNKLVTNSLFLPKDTAQLTLSISPVKLEVPNRETPLELRITLPANGTGIPIILLSHGHGPSLYIASKDGYAPLVNFYAENGFAVVQATHANSRVAGLPDDHLDAPLFVNERLLEMKFVLDQLSELLASLPYVDGRLDTDRIAVVGHSAGSITAAMLMGARSLNTKRRCVTPDKRIKVGVLLAAVGRGGDDLSEFARQNYPDIGLDFSTMTTRNLVVFGDQDENPHLTVRGADWHADPYHQSPGSDVLLTHIGGKHGLGGIAGYDAKETDDEDPDRLAITQKLTLAYIRSALYDGDDSWNQACETLVTHASHIAYIEQKSPCL